ncbi:hypothetical protein MMC34_004825 [Xylographa carneopallida]|nr:hypothetical protein [Xylographa carneopallida]
MPSTRRFKVLGLILALVVVSLLYTTSNARHSDQDFYDRTVAALEAKAKAKLDIGTDRDISRKLKEATSTQDSADLPTQRVPPEVVLSENHVEGRPKLKGGEKWDVSSGKESALGEKEEEKVKTEEEKDVELELNSILKRSPIIIFSKSYCPFSRKAKIVLLEKYLIVPAPFVVELDKHPMGPQLQDTLTQMTGRRTVPNVLISGKSIGGGDDVEQLDNQHELINKVKSMGGKRITEAKLRDT